eukprot:SAG11_NODE_1084_length_5941_cov_5.761897_2_plen_89_part_00
MCGHAANDLKQRAYLLTTAHMRASDLRLCNASALQGSQFLARCRIWRRSSRGARSVLNQRVQKRCAAGGKSGDRNQRALGAEVAAPPH